jgi:hypothetical protein
MKADEPAVPLSKYGLPLHEQHHIIERHFTVALERKFFDDLHHRHLVQQLAKAAAVLRGEPAVLTVEPAPAMPAPPPPSPPVAEPAPDKRDDLRAKLGLT